MELPLVVVDLSLLVPRDGHSTWSHVLGSEVRSLVMFASRLTAVNGHHLGAKWPSCQAIGFAASWPGEADLLHSGAENFLTCHDNHKLAAEDEEARRIVTKVRASPWLRRSYSCTPNIQPSPRLSPSPFPRCPGRHTRIHLFFSALDLASFCIDPCMHRVPSQHHSRAQCPTYMHWRKLWG